MSRARRCNRRSKARCYAAGDLEVRPERVIALGRADGRCRCRSASSTCWPRSRGAEGRDRAAGGAVREGVGGAAARPATAPSTCTSTSCGRSSAAALPEWSFIHTHFGFGYRFEPEPSIHTLFTSGSRNRLRDQQGRRFMTEEHGSDAFRRCSRSSRRWRSPSPPAAASDNSAAAAPPAPRSRARAAATSPARSPAPDRAPRAPPGSWIARVPEQVPGRDRRLRPRRVGRRPRAVRRRRHRVRRLGRRARRRRADAARRTAAAAPTTSSRYPVYISPIAVIYNLEGVDNLQLSPTTAAKIFHQEIKNWNDPAIAADNPDAKLPDEAITVVNRSDESGTTKNFTDWMSQTAPDIWTDEVTATGP